MDDVSGETGGGVRGDAGDIGGDGDAAEMRMVAIVARIRGLGSTVARVWDSKL